MEQTLTLKNGEIRKHTGKKQIAFVPNTLEIREVLYAIYSGFPNQQGTIQSVYKGDIVAFIEWNGQSEDCQIGYLDHEANVCTLPVAQTGELWITLRELHPWLDAWLEPSKRDEPVFIPKEIIPEMSYIMNRKKLEALVKTFDRFALQYDPAEFMDSKKADLKLKPREIDIDMDKYESNAPVEEWWGSLGTKREPIKLEVKNGMVTRWRKFKHIVRVRMNIYKAKSGVTWGNSIDVWNGLPYTNKSK